MASQTKPPSLGDSDTPKYSLIRQDWDLPTNRKELVAAFESIINLGGIQKLTIEVGKPIQFYRLVPVGSLEAAPPEETPTDDVWLSIRNNQLIELLYKSYLNSLSALFHGFAELSKRKLKPLKLFCRDYPTLRKWLEQHDTFNCEYVFGVETATQLDMPEDAVVLAGISWNDDPTTIIGIRIPMDLPGITKVEISNVS